MKPVSDLREYIGREDELAHVSGLGIYKIIDLPMPDLEYPLLVVLGNGESITTTLDGCAYEGDSPCIQLAEKPKVKKTFWRRKWGWAPSGAIRTDYAWYPSKEEFDSTHSNPSFRWSDEWESITIEVEE